MNKFRSDYWQVDMPVGWQAEEGEEGMISLYDPTSNGMLSFSAIKEDEDISDEYLEDLLSEHLEADAELYDVDYNDFSGVSCCYADEEEYWCEWYLRAGPVLLYITYYCPVEDEGLEEDLIESILESLTVPEHKILH